ncbi:hypothetical protein [Enterobacter vonholyi]|uniref:Uncharacterized protein n=1 Tax=Enterobacter vonholyi TaxID=2797505 RepID=A0ABU6E2N5_9ENTR|nr:hypothetical protein [Enterobacter vonholyi]MEB6409477.1 hypothetical protein [Enterobacter vonholyi]
MQTNTEIITVFCSSTNANLLAKAVVTYEDGLVAEGLHPFQLPLSCDEEIYKNAVILAVKEALKAAKKYANDLRKSYNSL